MLVFFLVSLCLYQLHPVAALNKDYLSLETCKSYRGICALLVVYSHLALVITSNSVELKLFGHVGWMAVSIFFFLSGYGLLKQYMQNRAYRFQFLQKRLPRILFPFLLVTFLYIVVCSCTGKTYSWQEVVLSFLTGFPLLPFAWYIVVILFFYVCFYVLINLCKEHYMRIFVGMGLCYTCWIVYCLLTKRPHVWWRTGSAFLTGMWWALQQGNIERFLSFHYWVKLAVLFTIGGVVYISGKYVWRIFYAMQQDNWVFLVTCVYGAILFPLVTVGMSMKWHFGNKYLRFLGEISLEIYLLQGVWMQLLRNPKIYISNDAYCSIGVLVGTICSSYVIHQICRVILKQYKQLFLGETNLTNQTITK